MASARTAWHVLLAALLTQRAPRRFEVRTEVPLSTEPLRADFLLLRARTKKPGGTAGTLRKLWDLLPKDTLLEFKSIGRPYRSRNIDRLFAYLHLYYADQRVRLRTRLALAGVLLVPRRTRSLDADVDTLGLMWRDLGDGYWALSGGAFALYVAEIDVVTEAENDDLLRLFGHGEAQTLEAERWFAEQTGSEGMAMKVHELEGFDEVLRKFVENVPREQVLAIYKPEERLAGLAPEQILLALPDEVLRGLSDAYLDTLPAPTRAAIRARIDR